MKHIIFLLLFVSFGVHANGKCGDEPYSFQHMGLIDTWTIPFPNKASITVEDSRVFGDIDRWIGPDIPSNINPNYISDIEESDIFNYRISRSNTELVDWQKLYGIRMKPRPLEIFGKYLKNGYQLFTVLIQHPYVERPETYLLCSIVVQRAVIEYKDGKETLWFRSYFHSSDVDDVNYANFVPKQAVKAIFETNSIWFPLALTEVIDHELSYVVLDIIVYDDTQNLQKLPKALNKIFTISNEVRGFYRGEPARIIRYTATLKQGKKVEDFNIVIR